MSCPSNPHAPSGYSVWRGSVPSAISSWAVGLLKGVSKYPFGTTWTATYNGVNIIARKDYHTWHYLPDGRVLTDLCWPGITIYRPITSGVGVGLTEVLDPAQSAPDPTLAVYDVNPTNWGLVTVSAGAIVAMGVLFALAIKHAGRASLEHRR